jgi:hypothetical protein
VRGAVYDAGALIAGERNQRRFLAIHRRLLEHDVVPIVPAAVVAQTWSGGSRQANLARLLRDCEIEALMPETARAVGTLRAAAGHHDVVDVSVVECAARRAGSVFTSDPGDIGRVVAASGVAVRVEAV